MVKDIIDMEERGLRTDDSIDPAVEEEEDYGVEIIPTAAIPTSLTLEGMFSTLEELTFKGNMPEASLVLLKAKREREILQRPELPVGQRTPARS